MIRHFLVFATMILILGAVFEENAVELLDVVFGRSDGLVPLENHLHCVGVTGDFLLITAGERFRLEPR